MLARTHIPEAPWWVVEAVDKKRARLNCISHLLAQIPYGDVAHPPVHLPDRERHDGLHPPPGAGRDVRAVRVLRRGGAGRRPLAPAGPDGREGGSRIRARRPGTPHDHVRRDSYRRASLHGRGRHRAAHPQPAAGAQRAHLRDVPGPDRRLRAHRGGRGGQGAGHRGRGRQGLRGRHRHRPVPELHERAGRDRLRALHGPGDGRAGAPARAHHRGDRRRLHGRRRGHRGGLRPAASPPATPGSAFPSPGPWATACRSATCAGSRP